MTEFWSGEAVSLTLKNPFIECSFYVFSSHYSNIYEKKIPEARRQSSSDESDNSDAEAATAPATLQPGDEASFVGVSISG